MTEITFRSDMTVSYIQHSGSDFIFAAAARQSSGHQGTIHEVVVDEARDARLIKSLISQRHTSPFEHSSLTVAVNVPLFVSREWERHRTQSYSESSLRYSVATPEFWIPNPDHGIKDVGTKMKPMRGWPMGEESLEVPRGYDDTVQAIKTGYHLSWRYYQEQLALGVHQEVARTVLPLGMYTRFWATANAINWLRFLSLRTHDPEATVVSYPQHEIHVAANQVEEIFSGLWPVTHAAWVLAGRVL